MLEQFLNHNRRHQLFNERSRVVLAVSGGIDSMAMVQLFQEAGISIGVAHANFRLRGNESDGDEQFVRSYCEQHALPFFSRRFDTTVYAQQSGLSIQMAARELRYAWFEELLESANYDLVATAHHLNDSIETILLNWVNGSSLNGLCGIPVKNGKIIRPLLFATRSDIEKYAKKKMIAWREDSSNCTSDYQRNFIRHNIMPLLHELNPSLEQTLQRGLDKLAGEKDLQDWAFERWAKEYAEHFEDKIIIKKEAFDQFPSGGASILFRLINHLGFNFDVCVSAINALHGQAGKRFSGAAHDMVIDRDALILFPKVDSWKEVIIQKGQQKALLGSWTMDVLEEGQLVKDNKWQAFFDADKIKFPLVWRMWKPGDVFYPLGMDHRKKVSDLLIDEKVSLADKSRVTVLESGGQVIWVAGYRIDNRFKITSDTRQTIQFRVSPYFG